jgi:hypothetical protein
MQGQQYATNNKYKFFPPLMNDGRNFTAWQPGAVLSENIRKVNNITSNWEYRKFLTGNADNIIRHNQISSCKQCGYCPYKMDPLLSVNTGHKVADPLLDIRNSPNDLKKTYLSSYYIQSRMKAPSLTQEQYIKSKIYNPN